MGWVTLSLRKAELKQTHSDYQVQLLDISREKRYNHRNSMLEQLQVRNDSLDVVGDAKAAYLQTRDNIRQQLNGVTDPIAREDLMEQLRDAQEDYEMKKTDEENMRDAHLQTLEAEQAEMEAALDQLQTKVETQLEVISAEMEAVGEAISNAIKSSTMKLS